MNSYWIRRPAVKILSSTVGVALISLVVVTALIGLGASRPAHASPASNTQFYTAYPNPNANILWNAGGATGVAGVQAAFNNARIAENASICPGGVCQPGAVVMPTNFTMPAQATWDGKNPSEQALYLMNAERAARGKLPFEGVEANIQASAQTYANYLGANNLWGHELNGTLQQNIEGTAIGQRHQRWYLGGGSPTDGSYGENLARGTQIVNGQVVGITIEYAVYLFMYEDAGSSWGHRYPILTDKMVNDFGASGSEGFIGVGVANYPNSERVIVWRFFDPCGGGFINGQPACAGGTTTAFTLGAPVATKLAFSAQPSSGTVAVAPLTVQVQDASSAVVTGDNTTQVTLTTSSGPGTLTCASKTVTAGVATFTNCAVSAAGSYVLHAASSPVLSPVDTSAFTVSTGGAPPVQQTFVWDASTRLFCFSYSGPTTLASTGFATLFTTAVNVVSWIRTNGTWLSWLRGIPPSTDFTISTGSFVCVSGLTSSGSNVFN